MRCFETMWTSKTQEYVACLFSVSLHLASAYLSKGNELFNSLIQNYDKDASPSQVTGKPTDVKIGLYLMSIEIIDENLLDMSVGAYLRMGWCDERLKYPAINGTASIRLPEGSWDKIWVPDVFIRSAKASEFHELFTSHRRLTLNSSGHLWYASKVSVVSTCQYSGRGSYASEIICDLSFESFGYLTTSLTISSFSGDPISIDDYVTIRNYEFLETKVTDCTQNYTAGTFPCLLFSLHFKRVSAFVSQVCIPSIAVVILSWVSFWIDRDAVVARLLTGFLALIIMTLMNLQAHQVYPGFYDVPLKRNWVLGCFLFVFASMLEFFVVTIASRKRNNTKGLEYLKPSFDLDPESVRVNTSNDGRRIGVWIDWISRIAFPVIFGIFVLSNIFSEDG